MDMLMEEFMSIQKSPEMKSLVKSLSYDENTPEKSE
jgi:hypothetical protein